MHMKAFKKLLTLFALSSLLVFAASCSGAGLRGPGNADELSAFEKIGRMLAELHSYRAIATVEYRANKGSNTYETVQHARITGEYRVEVTGPEHVAGSITVNDGRTIVQFNRRVEGRVSVAVAETPERSQLFLTSFIKNYFQSDEVSSVMVADMDEGVRTVLEAAIPGNHPYLATARLWVDNETLLPVKLIVFDPEGAERIIITYHAFEMNVVLDDSLFTM
jgi:outer membrane lipoprotein-sorting protein